MIIKNFLFHRISPIRYKQSAAIYTVFFDKIIKHLSDSYKLVNIENYYLSDSKREYKRPVATISFDDGYKDCINYSAEILKKYNCPASFYIVSECIEKNMPTWTFLIDYLFQNTKKLILDFDKDNLPDLLKNTKWNNKMERINYSQKLKPFLKLIPEKKRELIFKAVLSYFDDIEIPKLMMSWNDVNEMISNGFTIGSHSESHRILSKIEDDDILQKELNNSYSTIYKKTGKYPVTISYPCGFYDNKVINFSKNCGYKLGFTSGQRFFNSQKDNIFEIPRVELYNESWFKTRMRISGKLEILKAMLRWKRETLKTQSSKMEMLNDSKK